MESNYQSLKLWTHNSLAVWFWISDLTPSGSALLIGGNQLDSEERESCCIH